MEEIKLIYQLFDSLRLHSKAGLGIDRDAFVKFCPIPVSFAIKSRYSNLIFSSFLGPVGTPYIQIHENNQLVIR